MSQILQIYNFGGVTHIFWGSFINFFQLWVQLATLMLFNLQHDDNKAPWELSGHWGPLKTQLGKSDYQGRIDDTKVEK